MKNLQFIKNRRFALAALFIVLLSSVIGAALSGAQRSTASISVNKEGDTSLLETSPRKTASGTPVELVENDYREALTAVKENYASEVDYEKVNASAIQSMLWTLDPHSSFFTRAEFTKLREDQNASFYGIGVSILRHRDGVYVQSVFAGSPADRAGLRWGDRIVEIDRQDAREWTTQQVSKSVRGERGGTVNVCVERASTPAPQYFTLVRDAVPVPSIRTSYIVRPGVGYIGLTGGFTSTTDTELRRAISDLKRAGARELVLDLRNNPGGMLEKSVSVAGEFLPHDAVVVSVKGRAEERPRVYKNSESAPENFPLVVLINGNSASASEIVTGALQDHGRAIVVGETSFGKGLVQHVLQLPFGAGLTLTTAKYYTPYGRSIQRDYSNGSLYDYYAHHDSANESSATQTTSSSQQPAQPTAPAAPDASVIAPSPQPTPSGPAVRTAAGRVFYGGGGITPDIEVKPLDTASPLRARIYEAAFHFTRQLVAGKLAGLENYRAERTQSERASRQFDFPVTDRVVEAFRNYIRQDAAAGLTPAQLDADLDFAKLRIREEIAAAAFGSDAATRELLEADPQLLRSIEALPEAKRLAERVGNKVGTG
ncbi:MAG: S41 family peptidase [Pyrinomonadaceae bacterium]|nr:S41 family peptidase [Pyrinomonadaceae bacterium]